MDQSEKYPSLTPVVSRGRVKVTQDAVPVGSPTQVTSSHGRPTIELIREDGVIQAIDVICGCGEKVRIRCDYH